MILRRLTILALLAAAIAPIAPGHAEAARLKRAVTVDSAHVRLGDLFEDAGPFADSIVARAPAPGRRYVLDGAWLEDAARVHGLFWVPGGGFDRAVVERAGQAIGRDDLLAALRAALIAAGAPADAALALDQKLPDLVLAASAPRAIAVEDVTYAPARGAFSAALLVGGDHDTARRVAVAGRLVETRQVPMLRRPLQPGDILRIEDLAMTAVSVDRLPKDALLDPRALIGQGARRALRAGEALRDGDVRPPTLVTRNGAVTIQLRTGGLALTAQGRALDDGARGATVRVVNVQTRRTIEAVVIGPDLVSVQIGATAGLAH
jgi:flagella basal body P-ring formation protein FlgA